jgi:hypothetical protein
MFKQSSTQLLSSYSKSQTIPRGIAQVRLLGVLVVMLALIAVPVVMADRGSDSGMAGALAQCDATKSADDPLNGAWSAAEAEFYAAGCSAGAESGTSASEATEQCEAAASADDPVNGAWSAAAAEFFAADCSTGGEAGTNASEATEKCEGAASADDPVNGAWSASAAEFYAAECRLETGGQANLAW